MIEPNHLSIMQFTLAGVFFYKTKNYDVCCLMTFIIYDVCRIMMFVPLWRLLQYDICRIMTFVTLWCLLLIGFVALLCLSHYDVCHIMMLVALWCLSHDDVCRQLWRLSLIGFVAVSKLSINDIMMFYEVYDIMLLIFMFVAYDVCWYDICCLIMFVMFVTLWHFLHIRFLVCRCCLWWKFNKLH